jgi:hypothetical protein
LQKNIFSKNFFLLIFLFFVFFIWRYSGINLSLGTNSAILVVLSPLALIILAYSQKIIKISLITFFGLSLFFLVWGDIFWGFVFHSNKLSIIKDEPADTLHNSCSHVFNKNLGYIRNANCNSHKINYYFDNKLLSKFWLKTNYRGDRLLPNSNADSKQFEESPLALREYKSLHLL